MGSLYFQKHGTTSSEVKIDAKEEERPQDDSKCGGHDGLEIGNVHKIPVGMGNYHADNEIDE
jgi:hypothetical protein